MKAVIDGDEFGLAGLANACHSNAEHLILTEDGHSGSGDFMRFQQRGHIAIEVLRFARGTPCDQQQENQSHRLRLPLLHMPQ